MVLLVITLMVFFSGRRSSAVSASKRSGAPLQSSGVTTCQSTNSSSSGLLPTPGVPSTSAMASGREPPANQASASQATNHGLGMSETAENSTPGAVAAGKQLFMLLGQFINHCRNPSVTNMARFRY